MMRRHTLLLLTLAIGVACFAATTAEAAFGCDDPMLFKPEYVDAAIHEFYLNTKGETQWPKNYRGGWEKEHPCAWNGNELGNLPPVGSRCVNGGWHPIPPKGDGGLMFLEHISGFAEGTIPRGFESFQMTDWIDLTGNKLSGSIWNTSSHCFLHKLDLSHNQFSGTLPPDFMAKNVHHGEVINFSDNQFEGSIPAIINNLKPLAALLLHKNKFSGEIPDLSHLANLRHLNLADNKLTGSLGAWIKELKNLAWLEIDNNPGLSGNFPPELPPKLSRFSASYTKLSGEIPEAYGKLGYLRHFNCTGCDNIRCPGGNNKLFDHLPFSTHCKTTKRTWEASA